MTDKDKILFEQFLENKKTYNLNISYWRKKLNKALLEDIQLKDQPVQNKNEHGKNFYDGNPIFSYYSITKNKALRIIQENPKELAVYPETLKLDAWVNSLVLPLQGEELEIKELVISIVLTPDSVRKCIQTVGFWLDNSLNETNIETYILAANDPNNENFPLIKRYAPSHDGLQPIRVLQHNLVYQFENTNSDFLQLTKAVVGKGLKPGIKYIISNKAVLDEIYGHTHTPFVNSNGEIHIHETFLSYVWGITYSLFTLYDEAVAKPSQNLALGRNVHEINHHQIERSVNLFKYSLSLISDYTIWDKQNLPNPELYSATDAYYIEKSNSIYLLALNFILCHEFVHVEKGHVKEDLSKLSKEKRIEYEIEADDRAIGLLLKGITPLNASTVHLGILVGLCCLLFFNKKTSARVHPNTDDRIDHFMKILNPPNDNPLWAIAALAFKLWDDQFQKFYSWSTDESRDYKALYYFVKRQIEDENNMS